MYSATKAFVAGAMWALIGDGAVDVSKRVVDYMPEFATNGKDVITVEQVMLHTSGFPLAPLPPCCRATRARAGVERSPSGGSTGSRAAKYEYHPTSAHWVLAEIIERVTGRDFRDVVAAAGHHPGRAAARASATCRTRPPS